MKNRSRFAAAALAALLFAACSSNNPEQGNNQNVNTDIPDTAPVQTTAPAETWAADPEETDASAQIADVQAPPSEVQQTNAPSPINGIELSYYAIEVEIGDTFMPYVTMYPETASESDKGEIWKSENTNIATVDEKGNITGVAPGYTTVTVTSEKNPKVFATVSVRVYDADDYYGYDSEYDDDTVRRIELTYNSIDMDVGDTDMPYVTMYPDYADDIREIWSSSDESVATVDEKGNITAVAPGYATITVKAAARPEVYTTVTVHVNGDLYLDRSGGSADMADTLPSVETIEAAATSAALADEGEDPDDFIKISDNDRPGAVKQITLTFYSTDLEIGQTVMPIVTMFPDDAYDKSEIWSSSDENVATVDHSGNITAVGVGECIVTVQSESDPDVESNVAVRVKSSASEPTYIDGIMIVNKSYPLPSDYNPGVDPEAQKAVDELITAASGEGLNIFVSSGFRSYERQKTIYDQYVERSGKTEADTYSARPGYSEHQTGLCFDLNSIDESFGDTPEYTWLKDHAHEYGFIIRFPEGKENFTGYMFEPWHIRYLGKDEAKKVYESGLSLEEYLGVESKYAD
ncbi:MAG: D-alanyl-D-alanine carboxypeptidase family protein [Oscillospiraceae bacterium]|nr:D-alanyl-D-alanine carboxypeptidase family protein [Oscillospiraceae bacterium]